MHKIIVLSLLLLPFFGCKETLPNSCNIEEIKASNTITDECRSAIQAALPTSSNNLSDLTLSVGQTKIASKPVLFVMGTGLSNLAVSDVTVKVGTTKLASTDFEVKSVADYGAVLMSTSMIVDYSGSMSDTDIDDSIGIYQDFFVGLKGFFESEIRLFSTTVSQKQDFTTDFDLLNSQVVKDTTFTRGGTALYDAIGTGVTALTARTSPIRFLIVTTDGFENSSNSYDKAALISLAAANKIPIIIMGTLFTDVGVMSDLASGTNGVFLYTKNFQDLKITAATLKKTLSDIKAIEITNGAYAGSAFTVTINNTKLSFPAQ